MKPWQISTILNLSLIIAAVLYEYYFNHPDPPRNFNEIYEMIQCEKRGEWFC